jgi:hypothetical protein
MEDGRGWGKLCRIALAWGAVTLVLSGCMGTPGAVAINDLDVTAGVVGRVVYFEAEDCVGCAELYVELLTPLQARCGPSLEVKRVAADTLEG